MATQHRPGKENEKQPAQLLELFYDSVQRGNLKRTGKLLAEVNKHPPHGLWMHRALGLALQGDKQWRGQMVDLLLDSPHPPKPTEQSDFIKLALVGTDMSVAYTLFEHGFRAHPSTLDDFLQRLSWGQKLDLARMKPAYLHGAHTGALTKACAMAVVHNADEHWMRTLNACLPQPLPAYAITGELMGQMAHLKDRMEDIQPSSLNLARDLWWTDANLARLEYDKVQHARNYAGKPLWKEEQVHAYGQALSMIERSGIEEEMVPGREDMMVAVPRKRL